MEDQRRLVIHNGWAMNNDRCLVVYNWCAMKHNRSSVDYNNWAMVHFRRWVINYWWPCDHHRVLLSSFLVGFILWTVMYFVSFLTFVFAICSIRFSLVLFCFIHRPFSYWRMLHPKQRITIIRNYLRNTNVMPRITDNRAMMGSVHCWVDHKRVM